MLEFFKRAIMWRLFDHTLAQRKRTSLWSLLLYPTLLSSLRAVLSVSYKTSNILSFAKTSDTVIDSLTEIQTVQFSRLSLLAEVLDIS